MPAVTLDHGRRNFLLKGANGSGGRCSSRDSLSRFLAADSGDAPWRSASATATNLTVPVHHFAGEDTLVIGSEVES